MTSETGFVENVLKAFKNTIKEIEKGSTEHDIRYRFVKYFIEEVLGYEPKYIKWEKKKADLTIIDENDFAVVKIETKRPTESIDKRQHEEQAFKYEEETTRFIGLTNFLQFKLWELKKTGSELKINLDFSSMLEQKKTKENLLGEEKSQILFLNNLTRESLFDRSRYEKFDETYARIDITKDMGFRKLLDRLNFMANNLLLGYTLRAFGEYKEGYNKYQEELSKADSESKNNKGNYELTRGIAKYKQKLEEKYEKYKTFSGYHLWKEYSGKEDVADDEVKEIFCKETIYVFLNKLLFLRICEDKGFLEKSISNGGVEQLRQVFSKRFSKDVVNKEIIETAFKSGNTIYSRFYEIGILDWFRTGDGELNELLNRVLWILNQFDFTHVDRDILGNLYEKYLPSGERKRLGEFYTPTEVIDYILTSVGYTYSHDIETKDLLDPACGSGGFLVRASRRLISRYLMKLGKTDKKELKDPKNWKQIVSRLSPDEAKIILEAIQEHIYGLDINLFACHIAEMNLLFQIIDLYQKAKEKYQDYKLKRFRIYRTDSLEKPAQKQIWDYSHSAFLEEQEEIDVIKTKKFDFVVGNPPYVRVQMLDEKTKRYINKNYSSGTGNFDLYVVFIERGLNWLKPKGNFGYIISNKFTQSSYGIGIRKFILKKCVIRRIIDFGDSGVFKDVTNYPLIFIGVYDFSKESNQFTFIKVLKSKEGIIDDIWKNFNKKEFKSEYLEVFEANQEILNKMPWTFSNRRVQKIVNGIKKASNGFFIKNFTRPHRCLYTGLNEAFIVTEDTVRQERLEKELIKRVVGGRDIQRWKINWRNQYIIYPYKQINGNLQPITLTEYPNIKRHLEQFKDKLMARWFIKKVKKEEREQRWFEYADPRNVQQFENDKIITPDISTHNRFTLDFDKVYSLNTSYVIDLDNFEHNPKYLLGLLNSSLLEFFLKQISPFISGGYYRYINQYLEQLPIKLPETAQEKKIVDRITKKVDEILKLHKSGIVDIDAVLEGEKTDKLHQLPKVAFSISDNAKFEKAKTDGSKIYLNSQDFIEIKDKKIRDFVEIYLNSNSEKLSKAKDVKNMILNISVPKSDVALKEIIKKGRVDQSQIKEKTKEWEDEINELVYQIYGITKEERRIVEENL
jgi:type I restriction-modification system DNA methylase subunit